MQRPPVTNCLIDTLNEIISLAKSLEEIQLSAETDCPGWDVRDNLSHIISIESWLLGNQMTDHKAVDITNTKNELGILNENEVDLRRTHKLNELIDELESVAIPRIKTIQSYTEDELHSKAWTPIGEKTLEDQCMIRLLDCWAHLQDIKNALNLNFDDESQSSALILEYGLLTIPKAFARSVTTDTDTSVELSIYSKIDLLFSQIPFEMSDNIFKLIITKTAGRGKFVDRNKPLSADDLIGTHIKLSHKDIIGLLLGRKTYKELEQEIEIAGDREIAKNFLSNLNFMI